MEDIASGIQVTLDIRARFGLLPTAVGFDHDVDIAQSRRRVVEASDRDLRPRGEVEINGWKMRAPLRLNPSRLLAASSRAPR
jgi:hypothetical protein